MLVGKSRFIRVPASKELYAYALSELSTSKGIGRALLDLTSEFVGYAIVPVGIDPSLATSFLTGGITRPSKVWDYLGNTWGAFQSGAGGDIIFEDLLAEIGDFDAGMINNRVRGQFLEGVYYLHFSALADNRSAFSSAWKHMISEKFIIYKCMDSWQVESESETVRKAATSITHFLVPIFDAESVAVFEVNRQ